MRFFNDASNRHSFKSAFAWVTFSFLLKYRHEKGRHGQTPLISPFTFATGPPPGPHSAGFRGSFGGSNSRPQPSSGGSGGGGKNEDEEKEGDVHNEMSTQRTQHEADLGGLHSGGVGRGIGGREEGRGEEGMPSGHCDSEWADLSLVKMPGIVNDIVTVDGPKFGSNGSRSHFAPLSLCDTRFLLSHTPDSSLSLTRVSRAIVP